MNDSSPLQKQARKKPEPKPLRIDTIEAAAFLGLSPSTLKVSRTTGILGGVATPVFRKIGRKVVYDIDVLQQWLDQFENKANTAS